MEKTVETSMKNQKKAEMAAPMKVQLMEHHSIKYLEMLKETTYKDKKVVFILPNGREYK